MGFILFILVLVLFAQIRGLKRKLKRLLGGAGAKDLEESIRKNHEHLAKLDEQQVRINQTIEQMIRQMKEMKANVSIKRYNAFQEQGSDLSFSIAIVDDHGDGFVLTGIHSRHGTQVYAKPVNKGQSSYTLSPEETEVIRQAWRP